MLHKYAKKALQTPQQGPVYHIRTVFFSILTYKVHIKTFRQIEIELNSRTLPFPPQGVFYLYINLRSVEYGLPFHLFVV